MSTYQLLAPADPQKRIEQFIAAFRAAPNDAEIEIRGGVDLRSGVAAIAVSIGTFGNYPLMVPEARKIANAMEYAMRRYPDEPESATLPNIIMGLRAGCDAAETALDEQAAADGKQAG